MAFFTRDKLADSIKKNGHVVGEYTYGLPHILSFGEGARFIIGKFCSIAPGVEIILGGNHRVDWISTYPFSALWEAGKGIEGHPWTKGDVVIGNDVWIGANARIFSGVHVGDGACTAAGSHVTRDVQPYAIVAGNPAVEKKKRFTSAEIQALQDMQWWDWPKDRIAAAVPLLLSADIEGLRTFHLQSGDGPQP